MKISRQVGTVGELVPIFIQDSTVSTGAGLPNITISTVSAYYFRSDMTSTSSVTLVSTGTLGTWSSGQFLQINSTFMRGWYQFCLPNGTMVAGSTCAIHFYGNTQMAPLPMEIEITRFNNQGWVSSQPHNVTRVYSDVLVTSAAGVFTVDVSTILKSIPVTSFAGVLTANVSTIHGSRAVTTAAGILLAGPVGVSSGTDKAGYSVSSMNVGVNVTSIRGTTAVTTVAGYFPTHFDLELTRNVNSTVAFSSVSWSTQSVSVGSVDVTSFYGSGLVTTAAGRLAVGVVGVSSVTDKVGYSVSSMNVGVNVTSVRGTTAVTTVAGYFPTHFDLELTRNVNSTVAFSSVSWSTQSVTVGSVDVTSFYGSGLVTTAAGRLAVGRVGVSSMDIGVGVTTLSVPVDVTSVFGTRLVTSAAGFISVERVGVSSFNTPVGVSAFALPVGVSAFALRVGVSSFNTPVGVSAFALPVGVSNFPLGVDVTSVRGTLAVTTVAGYFPSHFDLELTRNVNSTVAFSSVSFSTQAVTVGSVDVSSIYGSPFITSAAGVVASHVTSMRAAVDAQIADRYLGRNIAAGADGTRTVTEAFRLLRNRSDIAASTLTVYEEDDATPSWSANVSTTAGNPISQVDPT